METGEEMLLCWLSIDTVHVNEGLERRCRFEDDLIVTQRGALGGLGEEKDQVMACWC